MHKKSNTYSSSAPLKSGPNMTGYYMGKSSNLMAMMQKGGPTSRGAALLKRAIQGTSDQDRLEEIQGEEAKRQGRGKLFGSALGLGGGLLAAALAPATGGLSLLAPAIGTALGKGVGELLGAGRARDYDTSGTVFGQRAFRGVDEASDEFNQGILGRAGMAGLKAGVTAGLSPGGGIYGKVAGKLRPDQLAGVGMESASAVASQAVDPYAQFGDFTTATLPKSSIAQTTSGFAPKLDTSGVFDASQQFNQTALNIAQQEAAGSKAYVDTLQRLSSPEGRAELGLIQESFDPTPDINLIEALGVSIPQASRSVDLSNNFFNPVSFEDTLAASDRLGAMNRELDALRSLQESRESLSRSADLQSRLLDYLQSSQSQPIVTREGGGLIEYQYGGGVGSVDSVLKDAGILATPEQLALFQQFDPSQLNQLAQSMQQSLIQGTQETDRQMAESGFTESGAIEQAQAQQREMAQDQFEQAEESAQSGFVSDTLAQAADDVRSGVEFNTYVPYEAVTPVEGSELPTVYQGDNISFQGTRYRWDSNTGKYVVFTGPNRPSGASDISLKESINLIGRSDNNVNIYTFKYRDKKYGDGVYQGVMAQEVPWASYKMNDGYLAVDYSKVDVDFKRLG
tara:strand:- start:4351 stop:6225 length:1875 start_codon:yes stop_codon:yes gene_type:complete